jgi:Arc/MetJ-type ribon-helix-helix transcriptional regulator
VKKVRVTLTLDREIVLAAHEAVAAGRAGSVSAWVASALDAHIERERRRDALRDAVATYEAEFGAFTPEELEEQARVDRARAIVVRPRTRASRR